jgi:hypothetical protein
MSALQEIERRMQHILRWRRRGQRLCGVLRHFGRLRITRYRDGAFSAFCPICDYRAATFPFWPVP